METPCLSCRVAPFVIKHTDIFHSTQLRSAVILQCWCPPFEGWSCKTMWPDIFGTPQGTFQEIPLSSLLFLWYTSPFVLSSTRKKRPHASLLPSTPTNGWRTQLNTAKLLCCSGHTAPRGVRPAPTFSLPARPACAPAFLEVDALLCAGVIPQVISATFGSILPVTSFVGRANRA